MGKEAVNLVLYDRHDEWLDEKAEEWGVERSFLTRRALDYYMSGAYENDDMLKAKIEGKV